MGTRARGGRAHKGRAGRPLLTAGAAGSGQLIRFARGQRPPHNTSVKRAALLAVLLAAGFGAWVAVARPRWTHRLFPPNTPRNLLLISIDTLRADHLGGYGYVGARTPRLDALARSGLRFETATTVVPLTLPAHSSLMTGTFPSWHGVRDNGGFYLGDDQVTLAEVLREKGLRTGGFVGSFVLDRRWGIAQGFERFFDEFDLDRFKDSPSMDAIQRPGSEVVDKALAWLGTERERPFFAWVHLYDAHTPYEAPEPYRSQFPKTLHGAYDAEIAYTDAQVGRLLDSLDQDGRLAETLVVVVGDHGEMLGEHGEQTHGFFIYEAATHVPLIMAGPGVPARAIPDQVRLVDVMPSVLELLGVAPPKVVQGVSLMPLARGARLGLIAHSESWYPRYHYGWSELRSVQDGRFKLIHAPRPELYDLQSDPREAKDRAGEDRARVDTLARALEAIEASTTGKQAPIGPRPVDAETEERLAALGYVGGSVSRRNLEDRPRGDPKDKIGLYNLMKQAGSSSAEDRVEEAIAKVRQALAEDPEIVEAYMLLGNFLKKGKKPAEAIAAYKQALARDDEHQGALFSLALAYKDGGRLGEARAGFERARELDPRNGKVLWQLADLYMRQGQPEKAEGVMKDALARKVDEHRFLLKLGESQIEAKEFAEAEKSLLAALEKKPALETARFNLGLVYEEKGQTERAIAAYEGELAQNPKAFRAAFNLAKVLQKAGRREEATAYFRKTVEIQPDFGTGHLYLAKALLDGGDLAGAEQWARSGLAHKPEPRVAPLGHYVLADVYNRRGRAAEADREVAAAKRLPPG
jgi:arylsulfatase A-like enzyme/Tfp pilus assembly protein PilF